MGVYKDPKRGTWYIKFSKDKKQYIKRGFATKKEASIKEAEWIVNIENSGDCERVLFSEICEHYRNGYPLSHKDKTTMQMNCIVDKHILPYFKDKIASQISNKDIIDWQNALTKKRLSFNTLRVVHGRLSSIIKHGMVFYGLPKNPCSIVGSPRRTEPKKEMSFYTKDEYEDFIAGVENPTFRIAYEILFYCGLRISELLALTWEDINLDFNFIDVNKQVSVIKGNWKLVSLKTEASSRKIRIHQSLSDDLRIANRCGKFLFGGDKPMGRDTFAYQHKKHSIGKKLIRIHDFRHSHAAYLISLGADLYLISKRLGHANMKQLLDTYGHLYPDKEHNIIEKIENDNKTYHNCITESSDIKKSAY